MQELTADESTDFLLGSLEMAGSAFEDRGAAGVRALEWFRHLQGFGFDMVPWFVVHDVGHLLLQGDVFPFRAVTELERWEGETERPLRLAYENRFLNALRSDSRFRRLVSILAQQDSTNQARIDDLVQRALEILLGPLRETRLPSSPRLNPVHLRDLAAFGSRGEAPSGARTRFERTRPGFFLGYLGEFMGRQAGLIDLPRQVREEDFFELAHWEALDRPHRRLFARRVQELVTAAGPLDVARTRVRVESEETATALADEGSYPTGGIGEITTHGSIENLVRSELVYRDETADVDLFALRWAEGDLLFYTRDAGSLHRKRRALVFLLEPGRMRMKDPRHATTRAVLCYALIARVADDLLELFGGEGARVEVRIVSTHTVEADREEQQLLELRLREAIRRGDAMVAVQNAVDPPSLVDPRRRTFVIAVGEILADPLVYQRLGASLLRVSLQPPPEDTAPLVAEGSELFLDPAARTLGDPLGEARDAILARVVGVR